MNFRSLVHPLPENRSLPQSLLWTPPERMGEGPFFRSVVWSNGLQGSSLSEDLLISLHFCYLGTSQGKRGTKTTGSKDLRGWSLFDCLPNKFLIERIPVRLILSLPVSYLSGSLNLLALESSPSQ